MRHEGDVRLEWGFWTREGKLVVASKTELFAFTSETTPPARRAVAIAAMVARNGVDRFVIEDAGPAFTLWDAAAMKPIGAIAHADSKRPGAIAPDGSLVVLGGCKETAPQPSLATSCAGIYDGSNGRLVAEPTTPHAVEDFTFTGDSRYVIARSPSGAGGLTVLEATTGKRLFTRPRWSRLLEIHGWNPPDLSEVVGDRIVIGHGDAIEVIELATGKTLAKTDQPGKTAAAFGPKTMRVAILKGNARQVVVWDAAKSTILRTFRITKPAFCNNCAVEVDEVNEDIVWLNSPYFPEHLALHVDTGVIELVDRQTFRSVSVPSATHRLRDDNRRCTIERLDRATPGRPLPAEYCNRSYGPSHVAETAWPYPGFDPTGKKLATIFEHELHVLDVDRLVTLASMGQRSSRR